jgi:hypothetical protein
MSDYILGYLFKWKDYINYFHEEMVVDNNNTIFVIETNLGCLRSPREESVSLFGKNKYIYTMYCEGQCP